MMKGDIDLYSGKILLPIVIIIASVASFGFISAFAVEDTCVRDTNSKIATWSQKMGPSAAEAFDDNFFVNGNCIDHVEENGIVFKSDKKLRTYPTSTNEIVKFKFETVDKVPPRETLYRIRISPQDRTITFLDLMEVV